MRGCASVRECACPSFSGSLPLARFPFCPRPEKLVLSRRDLSRRWSDEHGRRGLPSAEACLRVPLARRHQGRGKRRRGTCQLTQVLSAPVTEPCAHWCGEGQLRGRGPTLKFEPIRTPRGCRGANSAAWHRAAPLRGARNSGGANTPIRESAGRPAASGRQCCRLPCCRAQRLRRLGRRPAAPRQLLRWGAWAGRTRSPVRPHVCSACGASHAATRCRSEMSRERAGLEELESYSVHSPARR